MQIAQRAARPASGSSLKPTTGCWLLLLLSASAAWAWCGCAFLEPREDPTRFYVLTVPGGRVNREADGEFKRWKIGLQAVEVPAYLRSKALVVGAGANEIHFAEFDRWAEPLDRGVGRVMRETLSSASNVENVALNSHGDDTLDYEVTIRILACEGVRVQNGNSSIRFAVAWEARSVGKNSQPTKRGLFTAASVAWNGKDYGQLAERLSEAVAGLGKAIAAGLPMELKSPGTTTAEDAKP